jgi:hypothetical protein
MEKGAPPPPPEDPGSLSATEALSAAEVLLEAFVERSAAGDQVGASKAWRMYEAATRAALQRRLDRDQKAAVAHHDLQGKPVRPR